MITQSLMNIVAGIVSWFVGLFPDDWAPPDWFAGAAGAVTSAFEAASTMGVWIPLDLAFACAMALTTTYIGGGVVKGIRILFSHFTGGGGSAA